MKKGENKMKILGLVLACGMLGTSVNAVISDPTANAQNFATQKIAQKRAERAQYVRDREAMSIAARDNITSEDLQKARGRLRPLRRMLDSDGKPDRDVETDERTITLEQEFIPQYLANTGFAKIGDASIAVIHGLEKLWLLYKKQGVQAGSHYGISDGGIERMLDSVYYGFTSALYLNDAYKNVSG